jgi:hypothetical protein
MNDFKININYLVFFVIIISAFGYSQQQAGRDEAKMDSVFRYQGINPTLNFQSEFYDLYSPFEIPLSQSSKLVEGDNSTIWLRTEIALSYSSTFNTSSTEIPGDLMLPLYNQYLENSKIDPMKYVLGLAQTAAVGYLAYQHIKKYGFWK